MVSEVSFYCNQLIINDKAVNLADVQSLINSPYKNIKEKKHFETMDCLIFGDFVKLRFQCGDPIPYNPEMYDIQSDKNIKNTREKSQVEPNLYFGVIDLRKGWVWLPYRAKAIFKEAVRSVHPNFVLKSILDEKEFFEKIRTLDEVKFGVIPDNLFGDQDTLSKTMSYDINKFGSEYAELTLKYDKKSLSQGLLELIKNGFNKRYAYSKIVVAGRDEQGLELIFNTEAISTKISIMVQTDENEMIVEDNLFQQLIERLGGNNEE